MDNKTRSRATSEVSQTLLTPPSRVRGDSGRSGEPHTLKIKKDNFLAVLFNLERKTRV